MWDTSIIFGVEMFVFTLFYIGISLAHKESSRWMSLFFFYAGLAFQQWSFVLMIDIATDAGKADIANPSG